MQTLQTIKKHLNKAYFEIMEQVNSGDISPEQELTLNKAEETIAGIMNEVLKQNS